jgi:tetratricopeptide (TPR) repeat protein
MRASLRPSVDAGDDRVKFPRPTDAATGNRQNRLFSVFRHHAVLNSCFLIPAACLLIPGFTGCSPQQKQPTAPQDKPLAAFQTNLLQTAFDFATAIPVVPHIKDRSRSQESVVTVCFQLNQPQRALGYIEKIGDWRKGAGYADYAFYCAEHAFTNEVQHHLDLAEQISTLTDQDWRRDRIKIKISRTHSLLGQTELADRFSTGVDSSESGKVAQVAARLSDSDDFDSQIKDIDALIASGNFDLVKNALYVCAELFDRFYDNSERRAQAEEKIKSAWTPLPLFVRIELLMELSRFALQHTDPPKAQELVNDAKTILDGATWPAEYQIQLRARLAALRFRCGGADVARAELQTALTLFNEKQSEIINIDKAETLIPVAEAFLVMGDSAQAQAVYKQAVEAAVENPNSRPRAEDLSAICLSMTLNKIEPDEALWKRIKEIQANLGDPW